MIMTPEVIGALLAAVIGLLGYIVGRQQAQTERLRLRHELYDRRMKVFRGVMEFLGHVVRDGKVDWRQILDFNIATQESYFLFGKDIHEYMRNLHVRAVRLMSAEEQLARRDLPVGEERSRLAHESGEFAIWFGDQIAVAREKFAKHMSLAE